MKKIIFLLLLILFVGANRETSRSGVMPEAVMQDDIMHTDSLNKAVLKLEAATQKLNALVK